MAIELHFGKCMLEKQIFKWSFLLSTQTHICVHTHTPKNTDAAHPQAQADCLYSLNLQVNYQHLCFTQS